MKSPVPHITATELNEWRASNKPHQLIDVREIHEVQVSNIGGIHIPMSHCLSRASELRRDVPVVIHCRSGARSSAVVSALRDRAGLDNAVNLAGGITAWATEVDPELEVA